MVATISVLPPVTFNPAISPGDLLDLEAGFRAADLLTLKRHMKTIVGAQRAVDFRSFRHNFGLFAAHVARLRQQRAAFKALSADNPSDRNLRGMSTFLSWEFKKLNLSHRQYLAFWNKYLAISRP